MTTLKDEIRDVVEDYLKESREGVPDDTKALTDAITEVVKDFLNRMLD